VSLTVILSEIVEDYYEYYMGDRRIQV
jgi:hypothetical protein